MIKNNDSTPNLILKEGWDDDYDYGEDDWVKVKSKEVYDDDGFLDEYTWYKSKDGKLHIFMYGDPDIYTPDRDYADWETEDENEAEDWFYSYGEDDDIDIYSEDFENMSTWNLDYTVDGVRSSQRLKAQTASAAQDLVRKQYGGQTVTFVKTTKVDESVSEDVDDDASIANIVADKLANMDNVTVADDDPFTAPAAPSEPGEESPATPTDSGIAIMINSLIQDEWQAIDGYTSAIRTLKEQGTHPEMIKTLEDIMNEENVHVGQLQLLMSIVAPTTDSIDKGEEEGLKQVEESEPTPLTAAQNLEQIASQEVLVADDII